MISASKEYPPEPQKKNKAQQATDASLSDERDLSLIYHSYLFIMDVGASAYERVLPILPGRYMGVGLKMASDSKPVGL